MAMSSLIRQRLSALSLSIVNGGGTTQFRQQLGAGLMATMLNRFSTKSSDQSIYANQEQSSVVESKGSEGKDKEVEVRSGGGRKRGWKSLLPWRRGSHMSLWKGDRDAYHDLDVPSIYESISRLFENMAPTQLIPRIKEKVECYKLRFFVPGLRKEDIKITVHDGILRVTGEHKAAEGEESDDDEHQMVYYEASIAVPEDAKLDEIKAELKDGVLRVVIPRDPSKKKEVKEIEIQ
ncbi:hypothetical protein Droror1_Dr00010016 [Drosera rotundifolia]